MMRSNRVTARLLVGVMCGFALGPVASSAWAQVVPPPPPRTPPTPEYTPPPPPPTPPTVAPREATTPGQAKPAPDAPLPTLIERDDAGRVKPLGMTPGEAAIRALDPDEETMKKVEASLAARRDDLDRLVIQNVEGLADLRKFSKTVNEKSSMEEIQGEAKKAHAFRVFPNVLDRLSREGAIDPQLKARAAKVAKEYQDAAEAELLKGFEHSNTQQMVLVGFRRFLFTATTEAYDSLNRQLTAAAPKAPSLFDQIGLKGEMKSAATSRMRVAPDQAAQLEAMQGVFFDVFGPEERQAFLKAANPKLFESKVTDDNK